MDVPPIEPRSSPAEPAIEPAGAPIGLFRSESLGQALGVYLPATAVFRVVGLVRNVLLAWLLSQSQYGLTIVALLVVNVLAPLCSLGLPEGVARYVPHFETRRMLWDYLRRAVPLCLAVATLAAGAVFALAGPVGEVLFRTVGVGPAPAGEGRIGAAEAVALTRCVALTLWAVAAYNVIWAVLKGLRMFRALSLMETMHALVFAGTALGAAYFGHDSARAVLVAYIGTLLATSVAFGAPLARILRRWRRQRDSLAREESVAGRMLRFSVWAALAALTWQALQTYPIWYLNRVHGHDASGVFAAVRTIAAGVLLAATAISTVVITMVTKTWEAEGRPAADARFRIAFKGTSLLLLTASAVLAVAKGLIVRMFPADFAAGQDVLPELLLFFLLGANLAFLSMHFGLIEKTRLSFWPWLTGLTANAVLAFLWVRPAPPSAPPLTITQQLLPTADAAIVAMAAALLTCMLILAAERRPIDRGTWILAPAALLLYLPWQGLIPAVVVLILLAPSLLFTQAERAVLREFAGRVCRFAARHAKPLT